MLILGLVIGAVLASCAWVAGHRLGYGLGVTHGRASADAEHAARVRDVNAHIVIEPRQTSAEAGRAVASALVAELDRVSRGTLGLNATRAEALEHIR